jgi:hypothetical protein
MHLRGGRQLETGGRRKAEAIVCAATMQPDAGQIERRFGGPAGA